MRALSWLSLPLLALTLSGCLNTLASVVTAPVKIAGKAADLATTSQSEADQTRGRRLREKEQRLGRLSRDRDRYTRDCQAGRQSACDKLDDVEDKIAREERRRI